MYIKKCQSTLQELQGKTANDESHAEYAEWRRTPAARPLSATIHMRATPTVRCSQVRKMSNLFTPVIRSARLPKTNPQMLKFLLTQY
jgi:hypothetical protein